MARVLGGSMRRAGAANSQKRPGKPRPAQKLKGKQATPVTDEEREINHLETPSAQPSSLAPPPAQLYDFMVKILVKPPTGEARSFDVYHGQLIYHSAYFRHICEGADDLTSMKIPDLEDQEPSSFEYFQQWVNAKTFDYGYRTLPPEAQGSMYIPLIQAWRMAQHISVPKFADAVIEKILAVYLESKMFPSHAALKYLYVKTKKDEEALVLRKVFIHIFACYGESGIFKRKALVHCAPFVADVMDRLFVMRKDPGQDRAPKPSDFHFEKLLPKGPRIEITIEDSDDDCTITGETQARSPRTIEDSDDDCTITGETQARSPRTIEDSDDDCTITGETQARSPRITSPSFMPEREEMKNGRNW